MGIAALVLGIVAIVLTFMPWLAGWGVLLGVAGIVLAVLARKKGEGGIATAGLVCAIIGTVLCGIMYIACASAEKAVEDAIGADLDAIEEAANEINSLQIN